ncbi:MAG: hypothetical protein ABI112_18480 [Terracoccus sp.]
MSDAGPGPTLAESRRPTSRRAVRRRRALLAGTLVLVALVAAATYGIKALTASLRSPECTISAAGITETFDPDQTANAALIAAISVKRNLPSRAATIALTTAFQESKIRNLSYGDRDSLGLFQQRPSQGWGTAEQILDPVHATNAFYDALVKFKGYETADITTIAQKVQRSGYPEAYRDHEGQGRVLASTLTGYSPAGLTCRLDPATTHVTSDVVKADLAQQMGVTTARAADGILTVTATDERQAWAVAHWSVARAQAYGVTKVTIGQRSWDRSAGDDGWSSGQPTRTVSIALT